LFGQHCASCHDYADPAGKSAWKFVAEHQPAAADGAPNLFGFSSPEWIKGVLNPERIVGGSYFGNTSHKNGRMATWVKQHPELLKDDLNNPADDVDAIAAALAAQSQPATATSSPLTDSEFIRRGISLIEQNCARGCHKFGEHGQLGLAPDLTGYGSYEWMLGLVSDPTHPRFYRQENDRMPSFAKDLAHPEQNNVSVRELSLIVDWLRGQYYRPDDKTPVLPHDEEAAEHAVSLARTIASPWTRVIGASPPRPESDSQRAERLFKENCAACHNHTDEHGRGIAASDPSAPSLYGFGSQQWLAGLLDPKQIKNDRYFGQSRHAGGSMVEFVTSDLANLDEEGKAKLDSIIAALVAEAALPSHSAADANPKASSAVEKGRKALSEAFENSSCIDCHKFREEGELGSAPDLTGWASREWIVSLINDPTHERFYRDTNDRMPSFGQAGPGPIKKALLQAGEIELLARWLRGEMAVSRP
jgi:ubiquinol-cytochrome c reductase cytochrome b subunit